MASQREDNDVVRVDFAFKRELAEKVEGDLAGFCYQCGACVGDCPAATVQTASKTLARKEPDLLNSEAFMTCLLKRSCPDRSV